MVKKGGNASQSSLRGRLTFLLVEYLHKNEEKFLYVIKFSEINLKNIYFLNFNLYEGITL